MKFIIITSSKQIFTSWMSNSIFSTTNSQQLSLDFINPRDLSEYKHHSIFDKPYGGGAGLIMMYEPLKKSILVSKSLSTKKNRLIYLSPRGTKLNQKIVRRLASYDSITIISGKYRGVDERIISQYVEEEISIGDFILNSGDLPSMVLMESIIRILPNILNNYHSLKQESLENNLLDYPNYTKPYKNSSKVSVPSVLLTGHHKNIKEWRLKEQINKTYSVRPDLINKYKASLRNKKNEK